MPDLRFQSQPPRHTEIPRPKRAEGQWALGYTEPLNKNEQSKKDDDPLNVRARILHIYSKRGFDSIDPADLRGRFRWMGLYTQRAPGFDGGKTAMLEEEELDDRYFMMRVRSDGALLPARDRPRPRHRRPGLRPRHRRRHRPREHPVPLDPDRGRAGDLAAGSTPPGWTPRRPAATRRGRSSAPPSPASPPTRSSTARSALEEIKRRYIGNPEFSNLPRKFKTALTGHPSHDVSPETNDVSFVGTVHPEHGPGLRPLGRRRAVHQPDARPEARRLDPARRGRRRLGGRDLGLPRLRLPPAALARPG